MIDVKNVVPFFYCLAWHFRSFLRDMQIGSVSQLDIYYQPKNSIQKTGLQPSSYPVEHFFTSGYNYRRKLTISIQFDGSSNTLLFEHELQPGATNLDVNSPVYLGGIPSSKVNK